jgi:hypothetical protein
VVPFLGHLGHCCSEGEGPEPLVVTTGPAVGVFCGSLARATIILGMLGRGLLLVVFYLLLSIGYALFYTARGVALTLALVKAASQGFRRSERKQWSLEFPHVRGSVVGPACTADHLVGGPV